MGGNIHVEVSKCPQYNIQKTNIDIFNAFNLKFLYLTLTLNESFHPCFSGVQWCYLGCKLHNNICLNIHKAIKGNFAVYI